MQVDLTKTELHEALGISEEELANIFKEIKDIENSVVSSVNENHIVSVARIIDAINKLQLDEKTIIVSLAVSLYLDLQSQILQHENDQMVKEFVENQQKDIINS